MNLGYVISTLIASLVLLSLVALNSRIMRGSGEQTLYTMAKIQSDMVVDYLKDDMRNLGYRIDGTSIVHADDNRVRFLVRFEGNEDISVIDWWFDENATQTGRNPNVRPLYRRVSLFDPAEDINYDPATDALTESIGTGVVDFTLEYLDGQRQVIPDPNTQLDDIRQIRLSLIVESLESYDANRFERSTWRGEITPFSLRPN